MVATLVTANGSTLKFDVEREMLCVSFQPTLCTHRVTWPLSLISSAQPLHRVRNYLGEEVTAILSAEIDGANGLRCSRTHRALHERNDPDRTGTRFHEPDS